MQLTIDYSVSRQNVPEFIQWPSGIKYIKIFEHMDMVIR